LIHGRDDVRLIRPNASGGLVDVFLRRADFVPPRRAVLTSGCGGGITFWDGLAALPPLETTFTTTPEALLARMQDLQDAAQLYRHARGVHTSILATPGRLLASAEDIGRHNTVDRLAGYALRHGLDTDGCLLLTSGRVSSEMLVKARRMGVPVVASRTSPTSASLALAEDWRICLAGYVRRDRLRVYTHGWRLGLGE
jgi:FdhD protein